MDKCRYRGENNGSGESRVEVHEVALEFQFPEESAVALKIMELRVDDDEWPEGCLVAMKVSRVMNVIPEDNSCYNACLLAYHNVRGMAEDAVGEILQCIERVCIDGNCDHGACLSNRVRACRLTLLKIYQREGAFGRATTVNLFVTEEKLLQEANSRISQDFYDFGRPEEETRTDERSEITQAVYELLLSQLNQDDFYAKEALDSREATLEIALGKTQIMHRVSAIKDGKNIVGDAVEALLSRGA